MFTQTDINNFFRPAAIFATAAAA